MPAFDIPPGFPAAPPQTFATNVTFEGFGRRSQESMGKESFMSRKSASGFLNCRGMRQSQGGLGDKIPLGTMPADNFDGFGRQCAADKINVFIPPGETDD